MLDFRSQYESLQSKRFHGINTEFTQYRGKVDGFQTQRSGCDGLAQNAKGPLTKRKAPCNGGSRVAWGNEGG